MNLRAKNINKYFDTPERYQVLNDVSIEVREGELMSVYGESGSGKSTLLYILATLDSDFTGQLEISGQDISSLTENELAMIRNRHIGFVYQFHYLLPEFNVLENVMLPGLKLLSGRKKEIKLKAMARLEEVGMQSFASRPAYKLSGGQQQRVAIARALINDPRVIIADEPTGNLDKKNSTDIFHLFKKVAEETGKSVILATHNERIQKNSHRSVEMIDGVLRL